ncbi:hypothetical protein [Sphingomonas daechungensis]|uniref:hypothetical protein n=1 Tax=Sphingomonas daechungensis TaxID=1176646 RepID=UPI00294FFCA7|nr:hypothetical protein [Sphingomonas daechungensis]
MKRAFLLCTTAALFMPATAYAQSTGSVEFDKEAIVVTGSRTKDVGGIQTPDATKAKAVVTQEMISRSGPARRSSTRSTSFRASASRTTMPTATRAARSPCGASIRRALATRLTESS